MVLRNMFDLFTQQKHLPISKYLGISHFKLVFAFNSFYSETILKFV